MNIDKIMGSIQGLKMGRHGCSLKDICAVRDAVGGGELETGAACFQFGFIQGQKAARAEVKRKKKQLMERDTSGWYVFLSQWIERNIGNERRLRLTGLFARSLEDAIEKEEGKDARGKGNQGINDQDQ